MSEFPKGDIVLERVLEAKFAAAMESREHLAALEQELTARRLGPIADVWRALIRLELGCMEDASATEDAQAHVLRLARDVSPRATAIVRLEVARALWDSGKVTAAWDVASVTPLPTTDPSDDTDSPMLESGVLCKLGLAAAVGAWSEHDGIIKQADALWPTLEPSRTKLWLTAADGDLVRGRYRSAYHRADGVNISASFALDLWSASIKLGALLATFTRGGSDQAVERLRALRDRCRAILLGDVTDDGLISPSGLERLRARARELVALTGERIDEATATGAQPAAAYRRALELEEPMHKREALSAARLCCEAELQKTNPNHSPQAWLELRVLWCRIVVDAADAHRLAFAEEQLGQVVERAEALGILPLQMHALHLRARARLLRGGGAAPECLLDAGRASALAERLLRENAPEPDDAFPVQRWLLHGILPILDGALSMLVAQGLAVITSDTAVPGATGESISRLAVSHSTAAAHWRYGWAIWDHIEQSQELGLAEARHAYEGHSNPSPGLGPTPSKSPIGERLPLLQRGLRARDAVLQYFVVDPYLVVVLFGTNFFDWRAATIATRPHERVRDAIAECDRALGLWKTCGDRPLSELERSAATRLRQWLFPPEIVGLIREQRVQHLRVVPHDVLYRLPLDQLFTRLLRLDRVSFSYGATATEACYHAPRYEQGRVRLSLVLGAGLPAAKDERAAVQEAAGGPLGFARIETINGAKQSIQQLKGVQALHVICHGYGGSPADDPYLDFDACNPAARLSLNEASHLPLEACQLAVLACCWSGWMEHARERPVQGFPQALRDAGAAAVIAPAVPLADALGPVFAGILYRALRFLPAARALGLTLDLLRRDPHAFLKPGSPEELALLNYGGPDAFQFRYLGSPELTLVRGALRRTLGAVSFYAWLTWRRVRRGRRQPPDVSQRGAAAWRP